MSPTCATKRTLLDELTFSEIQSAISSFHSVSTEVGTPILQEGGLQVAGAELL
jgi:hypothetical protein